jgi:hypothetical protein
MFLLNNKILPLDVPFQHNGNQYPANWLRLSSPTEKQAIGITEVADPVRPDDTYYWVSQNSDGTYDAIPKDLDDLKKIRIDMIKRSAHSLLEPSDWMVIREQETGAAMDITWKHWRESIRSSSSNGVISVTNCSDLESLIALPQVSWNPNPDYIGP